MRKHLPVFMAVGPVVLLVSLVRPPHVNPMLEQARTIEAKLHPPPDVARLLSRSCGDCHSNQTQWPWYSRLEPMASLVAKDVEKGRKAVNFSEWNSDIRGASALMAACAAVETGRMPKSPYRTVHPESVPTPEEVRALCSWTQETAKLIFARKPVRERQAPAE